MTEHEAIEKMKYRIDTATDSMGKGADGKAYEDMEMAVKALEEIEKYRAIGTVEEFQSAVEKQKAKIPYTYGDGEADGYPVIDMYECPNCGETYEIECDHYEYCPKCGQHMDKSGLE